MSGKRPGGRHKARRRPLGSRRRRGPRGSMAKLAASVKRFLTVYLPQHRGASPNTVTSYAQALKGLLSFLSRRKKRNEATFSDLTAENVLAFLSGLEKKRGNVQSTRNVRLAAVKSFLRYAFFMGHLDQERYERLRHIAFKRGGREAVSYLEVAELEAIFRAVDYRTRDGFRDLVVMKLLYNTGARASEIAAIKIADLSLDDLRVSVTGKGHKRRVCSLWETTVALIRIYLTSARRTPRKGFEDCLFISQRRRPFTRFGIYDIVRRYARKAAGACPNLTEKRVSPHTIRHTTAVHLVESGADFNTIRDWLGHAHMSTTEIYAQVNLHAKRLAFEKLRRLDQELFKEIAAERGTPQIDPGIRRWLDSLSG
jgi:integrase/recombinase XerD